MPLHHRPGPPRPRTWFAGVLAPQTRLQLLRSRRPLCAFAASEREVRERRPRPRSARARRRLGLRRFAGDGWGASFGPVRREPSGWVGAPRPPADAHARREPSRSLARARAARSRRSDMRLRPRRPGRYAGPERLHRGAPFPRVRVPARVRVHDDGAAAAGGDHQIPALRPRRRYAAPELQRFARSPRGGVRPVRLRVRSPGSNFE